MTSATRLCPKCGAEIPADAPEGGCPGCLLESGLGLLPDAPVAGGLDRGRPASAVPATTPEDVRSTPHSKKAERFVETLGELGDYELLEEIGRGGQGVVYRAHQKSLNRTVALKVIGLGPWATEAHLKRFRREAEAAASLEHSGIVPIFEVGERDGFCYYSMKFVEGGQLDEVAEREPIPVRRAVELIAKLARTVQYAHEHGILHRDIKPGNVLVDAKGEPQLTDFGLARLVEAESTITHTLDVMGTPSYMAPEQAAGETTKVNRVTDIYGLGAVLYQLLTGHAPFAGGTSYETIRQVLNTEPRQPRLWNPKIGRDLSTICLKCLEKDPQRRYSSALALAEDLEHWLKHEPIRARRTGIFARGRKWVRRKPAIAALIASLVGFAAVVSWNVWRSEQTDRPATKGIAVLPFENLSENKQDAYFADGVQDEILTRLASIANLNVISRTSTQRYQSRPGNLLEIAKQLGVTNILEGSVQKVADHVRVNVRLVNAQTNSHLWAETYNRKLTDIFGVASEIAKGITDALQVNLTGGEEQALAAKPTNNPEAYDAYLRGVAFQAHYGYPSDLMRQAVVFYERAAQLDPMFALAWARLSRAHALTYFNTEKTEVRRDAAKRALEIAQTLQPNSPETLLALGYYQYWVLRDYGLAKNTFQAARKLLPGSSEVAHALGLVTRRQGNWDESIAYLEQGLALDPRNLERISETGWTYTMRRQFPAALKLWDRGLDITPGDPDLMAAKASIYQAQGNLKEAAKLLSEINPQTSRGDAFVLKVIQLRLERNHSEAIRLLQARLAQLQVATGIDKGTFQVMLTFAHRLAGDSPGAKFTAQEARNTLESLCKDQPDNPFFLQQLSLADAVLGQKYLALKEAEHAIMLLPSAKDPVSGPVLEENLVLIQTILGENSAAIATLERLLQTPYNSWLYDGAVVTPALLRLDPIWDPLRADPAFQKLCEEKKL